MWSVFAFVLFSDPYICNYYAQICRIYAFICIYMQMHVKNEQVCKEMLNTICICKNTPGICTKYAIICSNSKIYSYMQKISQNYAENMQEICR